MAIEYQLMIILSVIIPIFDSELKNSRKIFQSLSFGVRSLIVGSFSVFILLIIVTVTSSPTTTTGNGYVFQDRNFFGVTRIFQDSKEHILFHGTTIHGKQSLDEKFKLIPLSYYSPISPLADILKPKEGSSPAPQKIAALGLGVGSIACYAQEGRTYDFFEIDKDMKAIAENPNYFTYLRDCGSPYNIILGDARLTLAKQENQSYDIMVVDAFSSDNIPIHLITLEAIKMYLTKLKPDGVLVFHISNNHLDLEPILGNAGRYLGIKTLSQINLDDTIPDTDITAYPSQYVILTKNEVLIQYLHKKGWDETYENKNLRLWTDQYSNIISVMGGKSFKIRNKKVNAERKAKKAQETTSSP